MYTLCFRFFIVWKKLICHNRVTCEALVGIAVKADELEQFINIIHRHIESSMS